MIAGLCPWRARVASLLAALSLLIGGTVSSAGAAASPHDPPLEDPDLSAMAEPVRRGIAAYRELVEGLSAGGATGAERSRLAQAYGQLGQLYHAHGATEAALAAYANARRVDPGDRRWSYYAGMLHQAAGDLDAAREELEAALELEPGDGPTLLRLGEVAVTQRRLDDAERSFRRVLDRDPASAAAWFGLGQVAAERRDAGQAIAAFERVLELQPDASIAHYPLALAYRDRGDSDRANGHLAQRGETAVQSPDPLLREVTTLAKLSALQVVLAQAADGGVEARDLVGFAVGQLSDVEGAVDYLAAALEQAPASGTPALTALDRARVLDVIGALQVERGLVEEATLTFEQALAAAPQLVDAALRLGNLHGRQGRLTLALERYDGVLEREPENPEALLGRADALSLIGRHEEALADLARLEALAPGQGRIVLRAAATLERLGRSDQALARYREAMTLAATDREAASARAGASRVMLSLAATDARLGRFAEAAEQYARAVALDGASEEARVGEASSLLLAGRWVAARSRLEGSSRVLPASATLRHLLARLLAACPDRALRDGERAVFLAEELWRADPTPARAETLAMALAETGSYERAAALQSELLRDSAQDSTVTRLAADLELYRRGERCCASTDPSLLLP